MFIDFDEIFNPTEHQRHKIRDFYNNLLHESLKKHGECCCNCKHLEEVYGGHGWMHYRCSKTHEWIDEDIKCKHYKFKGFLVEDVK